MIYKFCEFIFDSEQLLLRKDGELIDLNEKPAKLLALLLKDTQRVHSKSDILREIWAQQTVSEQVIFQNINLLRSFFGNQSIKTFSKKGYQWQLPVSVEPLEANANTVNSKRENPNTKSPNASPEQGRRDAERGEKEPPESDKDLSHQQTQRQASQSSAPSNTNRPSFLSAIGAKPKSAMWLVSALFFGFAGILFWNAAYDNQTATGAAESSLLTTSESGQSKFASLQIEASRVIEPLYRNHQRIKFLSSTNQHNQALFDSPFETWKILAVEKQQLLLATKLYQLSGDLSEHFALRFYLQGERRGWQGYFEGTSIEDCAKQLSLLVESVEATNYFNLESDNAALAQLTLLKDANEDNKEINRQLIASYIAQGDFDSADVMLDVSLNSHSNALDNGLLHLMQTSSSRRNSNWSKAGYHINKAQSLFDQLNLPQLESIALVEAAWSLFVEGRYRESRERLNTAANRARVANEPLLEVKAHLTQSFMASKTNEKALMHAQLDLAKQLIELHQLNQEHQISVIINLAWSASDPSEKMGYYQQILETDYFPQYKTEYYLAAEFVRDSLVEQKQHELALASIKPWQRSSFQGITRAKVALSRERWQLGIGLATQAFNAARIEHQQYDALNAALLLLLHKEHFLADLNANTYIDYIDKNASKRWSRVNRELIEKLNYW